MVEIVRGMKKESWENNREEISWDGLCMYVLEKFVEFFLCVKQHSRHYVFSGEHTDTVPVHVLFTC